MGRDPGRSAPARWGHDALLEHLFATRANRGTRNIRAVQQLLGHSSVAVTAVDTACDDDEMRSAAMAAAFG